VLTVVPASAQVNIQCPCDRNNDADCSDDDTERNLAASLGVVCKHLTGGDASR